jgi:hypothetical protein
MTRLPRSPRPFLLLLALFLAAAWLARGGSEVGPAVPATALDPAATAAIEPVEYPPLRSPRELSLDARAARLPQEPETRRRRPTLPRAPRVADASPLERAAAPVVPEVSPASVPASPAPRRDTIAWPAFPGLPVSNATGGLPFDDGSDKIEPPGRRVVPRPLEDSGEGGSRTPSLAASTLRPVASVSPAPKVASPPAPAAAPPPPVAAAPSPVALKPEAAGPIAGPLPERRPPLVWTPAVQRPEAPVAKPGTGFTPGPVDVAAPALPRPTPVRDAPTPKPLPAPVAPALKPPPVHAAPAPSATPVRDAPPLGFAPIEIAGFREVEALVSPGKSGAAVPGNVAVASGGTLGGSGRIAGGLANAGVFAPGHSPGYVEVAGDFVQHEEAVLEIELAGTDPDQFDRIVVEGIAVLSGVVRVVLLDGFVPEVGDVFDVLLAAEIEDAGVLFQLPELPEWLMLGPTVISGGEGDVLRLVTIEGQPSEPLAVPAPSAGWLLVAGAVSFGLRRARRARQGHAAPVGPVC